MIKLEGTQHAQKLAAALEVALAQVSVAQELVSSLVAILNRDGGYRSHEEQAMLRAARAWLVEVTR